MLDCMFTRDAGGTTHPATLPEYASYYLSVLERLFGPRDKSFTLVGIDICRTPEVSPHPWFLGTGDLKHILIRLASNAATNPTLARWQLAHECFHLIDPTIVAVDGPSTLLEEGLATWFQNTFVPEAAFREGQRAQAETLIRPFMDVLPAAVQKIRSSGVRIIDIQSATLREHCPDMHEEIAQQLCQPMQDP